MLPHQGLLFQVLRTGTIARKRLSVVHQAEHLNRRIVVSLLVVAATVIEATLRHPKCLTRKTVAAVFMVVISAG